MLLSRGRGGIMKKLSFLILFLMAACSGDGGRFALPNLNFDSTVEEGQSPDLENGLESAGTFQDPGEGEKLTDQEIESTRDGSRDNLVEKDNSVEKDQNTE